MSSPTSLTIRNLFVELANYPNTRALLISSINNQGGASPNLNKAVANELANLPNLRAQILRGGVSVPTRAAIAETAGPLPQTSKLLIELTTA